MNNCKIYQSKKSFLKYFFYLIFGSQILEASMKFLFITILTLVGSCATTRHSDKVEQLRDSIIYDDHEVVENYMATIEENELKDHVYEIASEKYLGRLTGKPEHDSLCEYLKAHYKEINIKAPEKEPDYFQSVPKSYFPEGFEDSQNVIAYIEGSEFPDEYVYITGHSDHEGVIDGEVYYGADDNASGTAAILEIAEAFSIAKSNGHGPKRSLVFLHVTAEEIGLHGSRYYTDNPIFPIDNTVAVLNTDMIGRVDYKHKNNNNENYVYLIGSDRVSTELDFIAQEANNQFTNLEIDYTFNEPGDSNNYFFRSDHYNFASKGIPVVFFFNGEHQDYSKPTDTPDKINYPLLKKRTDLIFATAWYIANSDDTLSRELL